MCCWDVPQTVRTVRGRKWPVGHLPVCVWSKQPGKKWRSLNRGALMWGSVQSDVSTWFVLCHLPTQRGSTGIAPLFPQPWYSMEWLVSVTLRPLWAFVSCSSVKFSSLRLSLNGVYSTDMTVMCLTLYLVWIRNYSACVKTCRGLFYYSISSFYLCETKE